MSGDPAAIILFDGRCNLCAGTVRFVIARDRRHRFKFAALQSAAGQRLMVKHGCIAPPLESMLLLLDGKYHGKSRAALEIVRRLNAPWPLLYALVLVPRAIADRVYDYLGTRRYRWFGERSTCWMPGGELHDRFLDVE